MSRKKFTFLNEKTIRTLFNSKYWLTDIIEYVYKIGISNFYVDNKSYNCISNRMFDTKSHIVMYGNSFDGCPFIQIAGIRFILLCGDKLINYKLLK